VCYLQVVLADELAGVGRERLCADMDAWGYSFRLGKTHAWFCNDAEHERAWLLRHGVIDASGRPTRALRCVILQTASIELLPAYKPAADSYRPQMLLAGVQHQRCRIDLEIIAYPVDHQAERGNL